VFGGCEDERVVLFLKMREGHEFGPEIVGKVKVAIRDALSPRHVPHFILETKAIPYTINGKKV
jgi:acetoacetyl-CoA synthetase